jgi:hypothetical protein
MLKHPRCLVQPAIIGSILIAACMPHNSRPAASAPHKGGWITAGAIERSGAANAWEVVRRFGGNIHFEESASGEPRQMTRRGRDSFHLREYPLLVVDGVQVLDFRVLRSIPAGDVHRMRIMEGGEVGTFYGLRGGSIAVVVDTNR